MTLEITTKIGCSNQCPYCPQDKLLKSYIGNLFMTTTQFKKIIDNTPIEVQIDFAGFCEPFLNPWATWMMKYAVERNMRARQRNSQLNKQMGWGVHVDWSQDEWMRIFDEGIKQATKIV